MSSCKCKDDYVIKIVKKISKKSTKFPWKTLLTWSIHIHIYTVYVSDILVTTLINYVNINLKLTLKHQSKILTINPLNLFNKQVKIKDIVVNQGIIDTTRTEARQSFSCMFVIANIFKDLFTLNWNGAAVSVQYVLSMPGAILND